MDLAARAADLFEKLAARDGDGVVAMCAPGCRAKRNDEPELGIDDLLEQVRTMFWDRGFDVAYSEARRLVADRAVTEQHVVTLTRPDGLAVSAEVCVVVRFDDDGLVVRLDEYVDTAAFTRLFA